MSIVIRSSEAMVSYEGKNLSEWFSGVTIRSEDDFTQDGLMSRSDNELIEVIDSCLTGDIDRHLLKALAGSAGHPVMVPIMRLVAKIQTLVHDSLQSSHGFPLNCVEGFKWLKFSFAIAQKEEIKVQQIQSYLEQSANIANKMLEQSKHLVTATTDVTIIGTTALEEATSAGVQTASERIELQRVHDDWKAKQQSLDVKTKDLSQSVEEIKETEREAVAQIRKLQNTQIAVTILSTILVPATIVGAGAFAGSIGAIGAAISTGLGKDVAPAVLEGAKGAFKGMGNCIQQLLQQREAHTKEVVELKKELDTLNTKIEELKKPTEDDQKKDYEEVQARRIALEGQIQEKQRQVATKEAWIDKNITQTLNVLQRVEETLQEKANSLSEKKIQLQAELRELKGTLAEAQVRVETAQTQGNRLEGAIQSLGMTVTSLGYIRTIFVNITDLWKHMERRCRELADLSLIKELLDVDREMFLDELSSLAINWVRLGRLTVIANKKLRIMAGSVDRVMSNIPLLITNTKQGN